MRADAEIKREVEEEIRQDPGIGIYDDIAVAVAKGVVTLTGFAVRQDDAVAAEKVAKRVSGVAGVVNDIEVRLPGTDERPDPQIVRDAVAMLKNDLPESWERLRVVVADGRATLEGDVALQEERETAANAVRWIKGVKRVRNLIRVVPGRVRQGTA